MKIQYATQNGNTSIYNSDILCFKSFIEIYYQSN
jgi:hypothetical protein